MYVNVTNEMYTLCVYHPAIATMDNTLMSGSCMFTYQIECLHYNYVYHAAIATMDNTLMSGSCMFTYQIECLHYMYIMLP